MKTELQIAKQNIENIKKYGYRESADTHKQSCERFLEFLEKETKRLREYFSETTYDNYMIQTGQFLDNLGFDEKIKDLQNTISFYEKEGIK